MGAEGRGFMSGSKRSSLVRKFRTLLGHRSLPKKLQGTQHGGSESTRTLANRRLTTAYSLFHSEIEREPQSFYRYATQVHSQQTLDLIAYKATDGELNYQELLDQVIYSNQQEVVSQEAAYASYDLDALLSLGRLLTGRASSDLQIQNGVHVFDFVRRGYDLTPFTAEHMLHYVEGLGEIGRFDAQEQLFRDASLEETHKLQIQLLEVQRSRRESQSDEWLERLNEVYEAAGLSRVELLPDDSLPLLDRLTTGSNDKVDGPLITILMPTFSPGDGIFTALRSLLEQTWVNIEILVIDDGSPVEYHPILDAVADLDSRIRVLRQAENLGAYVARNVGLRKAAGNFIMTHDDDDWSHPDKLAEQVRPLIVDNDLVATTSLHVRTTQDMIFQRVNSKALHAQKNYSSLMFKKEVAEQIGYWDLVNRGGDSEFEARLVTYFGNRRKLDIQTTPLSFSRVWAGSLTSGEMRRGYQAYSRQLYYHSYNAWHKEARKNKDRLYLAATGERPFPVPTTMEAGQRRADLGVFDVIYVADYHANARYQKVVLRNIEAAIRAGLRVGYTLLDSPLTRKRTRIVSRLFELQHEGLITQVSHDDTARAQLLVVYEMSIGFFLNNLPSTIRATQALLIYDESPNIRGRFTPAVVLANQALQNLDKCFDTTFHIAPTSEVLRDELMTVVPPTRLVSEDFIWRNPEALNAVRPVSPPTKKPVVGYHAFGNALRWPTTKAEFNSVFHSHGFKTLLWGNVKPAIEKFGEEALRGIQAGQEISDVNEFFAQVDFWVYFPDGKLHEVQPSSQVLQAMRAGKVVILPPHLRSLYGSAAVYGDASEVATILHAYSNDAGRYIQQASLGQEYVLNSYSEESYHQMLSQLTA